jgi:pimeloyl-ACP methyl ester carboxylesterase
MQVARRSVGGECLPFAEEEARQLWDHPDFFGEFVRAPGDLTFLTRREFRFTSAIKTPWERNNVVRGRLYPCGSDWKKKPTVILLHGWNGELGYLYLFPYLARRLRRAGVNTAMIELPYHGLRKPRGQGAIRNFISSDLVRVLEATRQAVVDARALIHWLHAQGSPAVGVWGFSLGAWLSGLVAAHEPRTHFSVLMTPISRMDRAVQELAFCRPIKQCLAHRDFDFKRFILPAHRPVMARDKVLLVESRHDLFAPAETIEELWQAWNQPDIWRVPHGHISVLMALPTLERVTEWIAQKASAPAPQVEMAPFKRRFSPSAPGM